VAQAVKNGYHGPVAPISWIGDDAPGQTYLSQLTKRGISVAGMAEVPRARTPIAILAYDPQGDCACLYDPGLPPTIGLTEPQRQLIREADWIGVTIGPKIVTDELLLLIRDDQKLAWVVKNDPRAITPEQTAALVGRADLIFCNGRERAFLEGARSGGPVRDNQLIIETQGRRGAVFLRNGESRFISAEPLDVTDPTGAGDTFAGGVLAAIMNGETDLDAMGAAGNASARALLLQRKSEESESA
jgi:ribokinase